MNENDSPGDDRSDDEGSQHVPKSEQVRAQHLSARVPERIGRGAFSTGAIVMTGPNEFVIDFVQNVGGPPTVVSRVVLAHAVMPQLIGALQKNLELYKGRFGTPPELLQQPPQKPLSAQQIYDELKLSDDLLSGAYATGVMIGHTATEFRIDFLTNLLPTAAVSARVFLAAPQLPRLLQSLTGTFDKLQSMRQQQRPPDGNDSNETSQ